MSSAINYGQLHDALVAGGLLPDNIEAGRLMRCKVDGDRGGKKSGAYRLFDDGLPTCLWWNWKAGTSGIWVSEHRPVTDAQRDQQRQRIEQARRERAAEQAQRWQDNKSRLESLWASARPISDGDPVAAYLINRGLHVPGTDALRCLASLDYWHDGQLMGTFPAMLAAVTSPMGELVAIHRTYLTDDGRKAPVPVVKKLSATAGPMAGTSVKISAPAPRRDGRLGLAVAEGIETAIAASILTGIPAWSCVSAYGLEAFCAPPEVHYLYVMGDRDKSETGQRAATALARRAAATGLVARVLLPDAPGDWADELVSWRATV